jgi:hypothetical protein
MDQMSTIMVKPAHRERRTPPTWRVKCQSVMTLPPASLLEQTVVVRYLEGLGLSYAQMVGLS